MNKFTKFTLIALLAIVAIFTCVAIVYEVLTDLRGIESNNAPTLALASVNTEFTGLRAPQQRGRVILVRSGDIILCEDGGLPQVSPVQTRGRDALRIDCGEEPGIPTPTATLPPPPTFVPTPTPTAPASIPACDEHDDTQYHGLLSADESCHYNHTHGDNIFTPAYDMFPAWPVTTTISYPWQTFSENLLKHQGYKNHGGSTPNEECVLLKDVANVQGCIVAWRIQFHVVGGARGAVVSDHSFYVQFKIRNADGSFGYVATGGTSNFGILHCPYKTTHCPLPSDPQEFNILQPTYRAFRAGVGDGLSQWNSGCWNSSQVPCESNQMASYDWWTKDDWGGVNPDDLDELLFSEDPERNHSTLRFYEFTAHIDQFGPGRINYIGFTNPDGRVDESCTEPSSLCVPLVILNVDAGLQMFRTTVSTATKLEDRYFREFDLSPIGESWIEYPN